MVVNTALEGVIGKSVQTELTWLRKRHMRRLVLVLKHAHPE